MNKKIFLVGFLLFMLSAPFSVQAMDDEEDIKSDMINRRWELNKYDFIVPGLVFTL